jgi:NitT/TauT family transport system substrate-binding protein
MKHFFSGFFTLVLILFFGRETCLAEGLRLGLNWKAEPQFGGFYAADLESLYKKNSLVVKILEGGSGTPTLQMLLNDRLDYAVISADELLIYLDRRKDQKKPSDVIPLFAVFQKNPQVLITRAENNGDIPQSFFQQKEAIIVWQDGLPYAQFLRKKFGPIKAQVVPHSGGITALLRPGKILQQGFLISEPILAEQAKIPIRTQLVADLGFNPYTTVLVTTRKRQESQPQEVRGMKEAVAEGWKSYLRNPKPTNAILLKKNPALSEAAVEKMAALQKTLIQPDPKTPLGSMTQKRWMELTSQLKELGIIQHSLDLSSLF